MKVGTNIEDRIQVFTRLLGLLAPPFVGLYGFMVALGYAPSDHLISTEWFVALNFIWMAYGIWQYFWPPRSQYLPVVTIVLYHLLAVLFLLTVSGFTTFILCGWVILALVSYLYFSTTGYVLSLTTLAVAGLLNIALRPGTVEDSSTMLLNMIGVVLVSGAMVSISYAHRHQSRTLRTVPTAQSADHDRLLTIMNNLADAVMTTDGEGTIELYNAAALSLLDTNADIAGHGIDEVLPMKDKELQSISVQDRLKKAKHVTVDDSLLFGDNDDPIRFELTYAPIRGSYKDSGLPGSEGYIVIVRDITKAKSLEEERDEFISVVSHELRTPVTVAEGSISNAQALVERNKDTKANISAALGEAHEQVVFLAGMINDLSTLSRAERGVASEVESIDVDSFVHDLYNEYEPQARKHGLQFDLEMASHPGQVVTSRLYLHELMQNFITNALKYTQEGKITLEVNTKGDKVELAVSDTGIGISKGDQHKIFGKFYRSEDYRTRETSGTGLGLYVAAKLAKKLGTTIDVKSRLNHGARFSILLTRK